MSDISKAELKKEIAAILKDADLTSTSSKKVRQEISEKLDIDLSARRKEIDELVMEYIEQDKSKSKKNGNVEDDDEEENDDEEDDQEEEEEEEVKKPKRANSKKAPPAKRAKTASSDESEDASEDEDDEYSPKKKAPKKAVSKRGAGSAGRKKKGGSDDDSDEDWGKGKKKRGGGGGAAAKKAPGAKRGGSGYTKAVNLSPELAALVGEDAMPRHEVVKRVWAIIKERNLYDPKNKQFAICDDELLKVFGIKRFRTFGMMKFLKNHFLDK